MKYSSPDEFKDALERHILENAAGDDKAANIFRQEVIYERFLARIDPNFAFTIGGIATKCLTLISPATRDVGMIVRSKFEKEHDYFHFEALLDSSLFQALYVIGRQLVKTIWYGSFATTVGHAA